jgi:hypothetical protein
MANAIEQIYDQLNTIFGGTNPNQIFTMLMPGTTLDASLYAYETNKRKPATVMEAESKLCDQMFDIAKVSGSANGQRVSSQYLQALSVLVPRFNPMIPEMKNALRNFINTPMPENTLLDGKPFVGSLAEYYFKLYEGWIAAKEAWETKIIEKKDELHKNPDTERELFLEWYEQKAEGELAKIDEAMGKVLSFFSPTDMDAILGALAVGPGGELAEVTNLVKDIRLESPNGGFLYPVDLVPADWFRMLASDLDPVDLLKDPEFIAASISAKRKALQASLSQLQALIDQLPPADAVKQAAQELSVAQAKYTDAQNTLMNSCADNILSAVQIALALAFPEASAADAAAKGITESGLGVVETKFQTVKVGGKSIPLPSTDTLKQILTGYNSLIKTQSALLTSSQAVANAGLDLASAKAANYKGLPVLLSRIQAQLADIQTIQGQLIDKASAPSVVPTINPAPNREQVFVDTINDVVTSAQKVVSDAVKNAVDSMVQNKQELQLLKTTADSTNRKDGATAQDIIEAVTQAANTILAQQLQELSDKVNKVITAAQNANKPPATAKSVIEAVINAVNEQADLTLLKEAAQSEDKEGAQTQNVIDAVQYAAKALLATPHQTFKDKINEVVKEVQKVKVQGADANAVKKAVEKQVGNDKDLQLLLKTATSGATAEDVATNVSNKATEILTTPYQLIADQVNEVVTAATSAPGTCVEGVRSAVDVKVSNNPALQRLKAAAEKAVISGAATPQAVIDAVTHAAKTLLGKPTAKQSDVSARFMDLRFSFNSNEMQKASATDNSFKQINWSADLFFGSASGSSSTSSAVSSDHAFERDTAIQIGLKAAKVDIQRGWFEPGIFKLAADMDRLSTEPVSCGALPVNEIEGTFSTDWTNRTLQEFNKALLPVFPVAFVIVKDVTISFQASASQTDALHSVLDSRAAAGGGFLCFSASSSSASSSDHSALSSKSTGNVFTIQIPGPQILGWFLEFVPKDESNTLAIQLNPEKADELTIISFVNILASLNAKKPEKPSEPK